MNFFNFDWYFWSDKKWSFFNFNIHLIQCTGRQLTRILKSSKKQEWCIAERFNSILHGWVTLHWTDFLSSWTNDFTEHLWINVKDTNFQQHSLPVSCICFTKYLQNLVQYIENNIRNVSFIKFYQSLISNMTTLSSQSSIKPCHISWMSIGHGAK